MVVEREFGADPELKSLYQIYLSISLLGGFLWWMIPVAAYTMLSFQLWMGIAVALSFFVPLLMIVAVVLYWIPRFHSSIQYVLEDDKIMVYKGVWWKTKSFVPYNRITNVNIYQGPISRSLGLGKLSIQTAGFSGASAGGGKVSEAEIIGVHNFEAVKDFIMNLVKGMKPEAVEAEAEGKPTEEINQEILKELQKIRRALEK